MSKSKDLAAVVFENLADSLQNEDLSDVEAMVFYEELSSLAEQEAREIEDELEDEPEDDEDEDD